MCDFSVVIPTCNRDVLLKRALDSVFNQQGVSFEIIVVDDGLPSRPGREGLLAYLKSRNVSYVSTGGGKGGGYSRNIGIELAKSDLVAFLDDDDQWMPEKLLQQKKLMERSDIGICYTAVLSCCENETAGRLIFHLPGNDDQFKAIMKKNFIGTTSSVVVRTAILRGIGGFDPDLPALQDYDLYIRILKHHRIAWTSEPLTCYFDYNRNDKVSASRIKYIRAAQYLRDKYKNEKFYNAMHFYIWKVRFLKLFRSKLFFHETLHAWFHNFKIQKK